MKACCRKDALALETGTPLPKAQSHDGSSAPPYSGKTSCAHCARTGYFALKPRDPFARIADRRQPDHFDTPRGHVPRLGSTALHFFSRGD